MSELVPVDSDRFQNMETVASLRMKGISDTAIARQIGVPRKVVVELFNEYKDIISRDADSRDMAKDHLNMMVQHFDGLIKRYYDLLEELDAEDFNHNIAAQKNSALKQIADLESKRLDALQKAGLLDGADMGDELAEMEEKQAILIDILRNELCPQCRAVVAQKLSKATKVVEAKVIYDSDEDTHE